MADRLRRDRRNRRIKKIGATGVALLLIAAGGWLISAGRNPKEYDFGGITCSRVKAVVPQMMDGTLDMDTMTKVKRHLEECPRCKPLAEKMKGHISMGDAPCDDPNCRGHDDPGLLASLDQFLRTVP